MYRNYGVSTRHPRRSSPPLSPQYVDRGLSLRTRLNIQRLLILDWSPDAIATREGCCRTAVTNVRSNLKDYGNVRRLVQGKLGATGKIKLEDWEALFDHLV